MLFFLPERKVDEIFSALRIGHPEIHGSELVFGVTQVGGQDRKCILGGLPSLFDAYQSVHRKRVPKAMGCRLCEVDVPDDPSFLIEVDHFQCLMKNIMEVSNF